MRRSCAIERQREGERACEGTNVEAKRSRSKILVDDVNGRRIKLLRVGGGWCYHQRVCRICESRFYPGEREAVEVMTAYVFVNETFKHSKGERFLLHARLLCNRAWILAMHALACGAQHGPK